MSDNPDRAPWWKRGVIYQVYPRSFQDSDGDGVGDLAGVAARLDHIARLGVDTIWLSPVFPSPMADFGYDVADYCAIDPLFGDMAAFDALLAAAHARGLKLLLDFVPNHSSDQHPWFIESRSSRDNVLFCQHRVWGQVRQRRLNLFSSCQIQHAPIDPGLGGRNKDHDRIAQPG